MTKITISELENYLWESAVILRGSMSAGSYKNFIFPLLFYKRICDVYDEEYKEALAVSSGDEEYAVMSENHKFIIPKECHWSVVRNTSMDVGKAIQKALKGIESANASLCGVFGDATWTNKERLPDSLLKDLIEHLSSKILSIENCPADELGIGYEYLVGKFADDSGHTAQEFYTNRTIVHLMTELLQPRSSERIYDPTCGSGGMLISSVVYLKENNQEWRSVKLYGQELNPLTSSIGKMNLFLHGIENFEIVQGDTLSNPHFVENGKLKQFDIVLANPPYSIKQWDRLKFENDPYGRNIIGTPPQIRADFAFFQHILKSMDPKTGRCAILFPHGILFREEERTLREKLIKMDVVECIIGVAKGLFFNSPMEACVVICNNSKQKNMIGKVKFIDAKNDFVKDGAHNKLSDENIRRIKDAYFAENDIPGFMAVKTNDELLKNGAKLSLALNVASVAQKHETTVDEAFDIWNESRFELENAMSELMTMISGGVNNEM